MNPPGSSSTNSRDPLTVPGSVYSIGTSFAIDTLEKMFNSGELRNSDVCINLATLLRNHLTSQVQKYDDVMDLFKRELQVLFTEVVAMISRGAKHPNPRLLFYLNDYDISIPDAIRRPYTEHRGFLRDLIKLLIKRFDRIFEKRQAVVNGVTIDAIVNPRSMLPHQFIYNHIKSHGFQDMVMISHCPLDFHIHRHVKKFALIETHTGKYKKSKELGEKVFKHHLPFTPSLHMLLGDKDYIIQTASIKEKKTILDLAAAKHWELSTAASIDADLKQAGIVTPLKFD